MNSDTAPVTQPDTTTTEPDNKKEFPGPSAWPFWTAVLLSGMFIHSIFTPWAVVWWAGPVTVAAIAWSWPTNGVAPERAAAAGRPS